jgi:HEPN domain-containing protein
MMEIHHAKQEVCTTRPAYREGKTPKTVKVYTCAQEAKYLIATNVPSLGVHNELVKLFSIYGNIEEHKMLDEYPCEKFCETILLKFAKIECARFVTALTRFAGYIWELINHWS